MCFAPQRRALFRHLHFQKLTENGVLCTFWLGNVLRATTACTFSTSQLPKVLWPGVFCTFWLGNVLRATTACTFSTSQLPKVLGPGVFCTFWLGNVLRATTACTFSTSSTSKSGPNMVCFLNFDFQTRFAPQRRALFRHLNFQKWSDVGVLCTFWLGNVLGATTACNFSSHMTTWLRTRRFSEPTFRPYFSEPQIIQKTQCFVTFLPFRAPASSFFSLFLFSDLLSSARLLSDSSHLCFSICPYCRKTSKLPSIIWCIYIYTILYIRYIRGTYSKSLDPGRSTTWNRKPQKPMS